MQIPPEKKKYAYGLFAFAAYLAIAYFSGSSGALPSLPNPCGGCPCWVVLPALLIGGGYLLNNATNPSTESTDQGVALGSAPLAGGTAYNVAASSTKPKSASAAAIARSQKPLTTRLAAASSPSNSSKSTGTQTSDNNKPINCSSCEKMIGLVGKSDSVSEAREIRITKWLSSDITNNEWADTRFRYGRCATCGLNAVNKISDYTATDWREGNICKLVCGQKTPANAYDKSRCKMYLQACDWYKGAAKKLSGVSC